MDYFRDGFAEMEFAKNREQIFLEMEPAYFFNFQRIIKRRWCYNPANNL